ncbi:MAG: GTP cyclohydrolase I [archaeon]
MNNMTKNNSKLDLTEEQKNMIAYHYRGIFECLSSLYDLDVNDPNLIDTPERIAKLMVDERCQGINSKEKCKKLLSVTFPTEYEGIIIAANPTKVYSLCPHHFENVTYKVWVGYIPQDKVIGLSKFSRVIKLFGSQPIMQEDFTYQLHELFEEALNPKGLIVIVKGQHYCMLARGVKTEEQWTVTSQASGLFKDDLTVKEEFLVLCQSSLNQVY